MNYMRGDLILYEILYECLIFILHLRNFLFVRQLKKLQSFGKEDVFFFFFYHLLF